MQAMLDAKLAVEKDPKLLKAHHRLAQAQLGLERFKAALQSAQAGQCLLNMKADRTTDFTILMDQIAMAGALKADYAGFDGRILQVGSLQPSLLLGLSNTFKAQLHIADVPPKRSYCRLDTTGHMWGCKVICGLQSCCESRKLTHC